MILSHCMHGLATSEECDECLELTGSLNMRKHDHRYAQGANPETIKEREEDALPEVVP